MFSLVDLQQTSPSPICPGDDVIFTCTVTVSANESVPLLLFFSNPLDDQDRALHDAGSTGNAKSLPVGLFSTKLVEASNDSIVATATMKKITHEDTACVGIKCKDGPGEEKVKYVEMGKNKSIHIN